MNELFADGGLYIGSGVLFVILLIIVLLVFFR